MSTADPNKKKQLLQAIQAAGLWEKCTTGAPWIAAADYYQQITGDRETKPPCGDCCRKIKKWLQA